MKLSAFKFALPTKYIATQPAENRDDARLMVVHRDTETIEHRHFRDVLEYLQENDSLVINDTRVLPALLQGRKEKTGAEIEVMLLRELDSEQLLWDTLVDPARKIRVGNKLFFGNDDLVAEVLDNTTSRGRTLKFLFEGSSKDLKRLINQMGDIPLPTHIRSRRKPSAQDKDRYQTVYARHTGAVVTPAAGLHFTPHMLKRLALQGSQVVPITLHLGMGALRPVDVEDLSKYKVGTEFVQIESHAADAVNHTLSHKGRVCAVGVSTAKALESSVSVYGALKPKCDWINTLIVPPYNFRVCSALITNFHLPESLHLMAAAAFGGYDLIMEAYQTAIREKYRFFVYGDAMLIL